MSDPVSNLTNEEIDLNESAFDAAFTQAWDSYSEDMKILMDYGDGLGFQDTDKDDCLRTLLTVAIEAYIRASENIKSP